MSDRPLTSAQVPPETVAALRPALGELVESIVAAVRAESPGYAEVLGSPEGGGIRLGIEQAVNSFVEAIDGYVRTQSDEAGDRERRRRRVASLLLDPDGHDPKAIERAAELARWPVPDELAVLALAGDSPGPVARGLDLDVLAGADGEGAWLLIPDPDGPGRAATIGRAVGDRAAALGPTVPLRDAHRSLRWARLTLALVRKHAVPSGHPTRAVDHLAALIVNQDEELAGAIVAERLGPLDGLRARERERLLQTLTSWLGHQRHIPSVAAELGIHPQTVRYRIGKLSALLGGSLERPEGRFELELALRARGT